MNKDKFYDQYPLIFPDREPEKGFQCGKGWYQLLDALFYVITQDLSKVTPEDRKFRIIYLKEKYGKLRIGCENATPYIKQTLLQAEEMSAHICETCGEYGELRDSAHWIKVRCDSCENNHFSYRRQNIT
jgi:hypothetical protein